MANPTGTYYMDGRDIFSVYGIFVEDGSDGFLRFPPSKEKFTHDWGDANGVETDLSRVFTGEREIVLKMCMVAPDPTTFFENHDAFLSHLTQPGERRIRVAEFDDRGRDYFCYYDNCSEFTRYTRIKGTDLIGCKFTLRFVEADPVRVPLTGRFLVDDAGRHIVT